MDALLKDIASKDDKTLLNIMKAADSRMLAEFTSDQSDPLSLISPEKGIAYLYILLARIRSPNNGNLVHHLIQFSLFCKFSTGVLKLVNQDLFDLVQILQTRLPPDVACMIIVNIACRWADRKEVPLTLASDLAIRLCLEGKYYRLATKLLDLPITYLSEDYGVDASNFLLYHYYGGMIYLGLKNYEKAFEFFSITLYVPGSIVSQIQIEASKKLHLLSLITNVQNIFPKQLPPGSQKAITASVSAYSSFVDAFNSGSFRNIQNAFTDHSQTFSADGNLGIAKQCLDAFASWKIMQLTKTYITLSLSDIERQLGGSIEFIQPLNIQQKLVKMIKNGQIYARIDAKEKIIHFIDQNTISPQKELDHQLDSIMKLGSQIIEFDKKVGKSKAYLTNSKSDYQMMSEADEMFN
ncbi:COP9 signalosome complex subunit 3 [Boothiomyces macroporosus]|uniref:COP9 signalosome complex subunit 3 n=1 Tax=Boothiomyces macroporosus TaxID=261099 RepID=A0AAD5Y6P5_9FUNG|nr:COP9 signalosome complex subunit 3 [Boothiomyces macroporosus]KAJ3259187.1 COP9 signalosome complex subunit 3 [Boothiomyces macroporosus]